MTDAEVAAAMQADTPLNNARKQFSSACGRIEQQSAQGATIFDIRRLEFEAVRKIAAALGVDLPAEDQTVV